MKYPVKKLSRKTRDPEKGGRWAILGGVFDPVHNGHLTLAADIHAARRFDGVLFVPSYDPPHKNDRPTAPFEDRVAMLNLAIADVDHYRLSVIEAEMDLPGYTLNTVRALKKRYPAAEFAFILGADNVSDFKNWYQPAAILEEVSVVAGARPGYRRDEGFPAEKIEYVETSLVNVSSTVVRRRLQDGIALEPLCELVPRPVAEYILDRKLYQ